jgi:hypothetical protein
LKNIILTIIVIPLLFACNDESILVEACKELNGFCETGIVADSACKAERKHVLLLAYELEDETRKYKAPLQYQQLLGLEALSKCSYKQSLIEYVPINQKFPKISKIPPHERTTEEADIISSYSVSIAKRKRTKRENYLNSNAYLNQLAKDTTDATYPYLLYWQWSRKKNKQAIKRLISLHDLGHAVEYDLLYRLAQESSGYDPKASKSLLFKTLEGYPASLYSDKTDAEIRNAAFHASSDSDRIHYPVLRSLIQLSFKSEEYETAYVLAQVLHMNKDRSADSEMIIEFMKDQSADLSKLDRVANDIDDALDDGRFKRFHYTLLKG